MQGEIVIAVAGQDLDFHDISVLMKLDRTSSIRKGDAVTRSRVAKMDRWAHSIPICDNAEVNIKLLALTQHLIANEGYFQVLSSDKSIIRLNIYYRTDEDQFGFQFSEEIISNLCALKVPLGIHILA